jgi:hypothetical protein
MGEKVRQMSLEAIEKVAETERASKERRTAAEAQARKLASDAERDGLALLQQTRNQADEEGKELLRAAEERAEKRSNEILAQAREESEALSAAAEKNLDRTAEFIVERVVSH